MPFYAKDPIEPKKEKEEKKIELTKYDKDVEEYHLQKGKDTYERQKAIVEAGLDEAEKKLKKITTYPKPAK